MPLGWEILHPGKLILVEGVGDVTLKDVEVCLDAIVTAGAMLYAKLFDASRLVFRLDDHDLMMLGARVSAYAATLKSGPLAFVATDSATRETIARYVNLARGERPVKVFASAPDARAWLAAQQAGGASYRAL